jgi:predicted nucleic-acid-binding protein
MNPDSARASIHVDDPKLSIDAFDKHQDAIRAAMSRINDILYNLKGTSAYSALRSKLALESQDIQSLKVQRIIKSNNINYDVYISFVIDGEEYYGVIKNIMNSPEFTSEVFKDYDLYQAKEWVVKIKGLIIKTIKQWLKPEPGFYKLLNDELICYSVETGKMLKMEKGIEIELVRAHSDRIIIKHESDYYNLVGDNYIYFNWWFEKVI